MWLMIFTILPIAGLSYVGWHLWHLLPQNNLLRLATAAVIFISVRCLTSDNLHIGALHPSLTPVRQFYVPPVTDFVQYKDFGTLVQDEQVGGSL